MIRECAAAGIRDMIAATASDLAAEEAKPSTGRLAARRDALRVATLSARLGGLEDALHAVEVAA